MHKHNCSHNCRFETYNAHLCPLFKIAEKKGKTEVEKVIDILMVTLDAIKTNEAKAELKDLLTDYITSKK